MILQNKHLYKNARIYLYKLESKYAIGRYVYSVYIDVEKYEPNTVYDSKEETLQSAKSFIDSISIGTPYKIV